MILVDGLEHASIQAMDRGLAYGDGVFRTLRAEAGQPLWWADQYAKLAADCMALSLTCPDESLLREEAGRVATGEGDDGVVKIMVTRGSGMRGYAYADGQTPTRIVLSAPLPASARADAPPDITARWCDLKLGHQPRLAGIKHLNRLENVLARAEWNDPAVFEGILCDETGAVIGGVMSNLFWMKDGALYTPDLQACGVAGVARARILRAAARRGIATHIGLWSPDVILASDEMMICNSVMGVRRVATLGGTSWTSAGWTTLWNNALHENSLP
ncbi:MAG: aminodeoxychorismate lyase [Thiobacillus sp.]|nr:aminodeoxychorismate lyase [Thiobacillus sp.]